MQSANRSPPRRQAIGPSRRKVSADQGRVHVIRLHGARELNETLSPTRNSTAHPGRGQPCRGKAFLRLAKSYVQLLHLPVPAPLQMALQSESLISGLEIARPFCHWACP
jgi:hypothetical protein